MNIEVYIDKKRDVFTPERIIDIDKNIKKIWKDLDKEKKKNNIKNLD